MNLHLPPVQRVAYTLPQPHLFGHFFCLALMVNFLVPSLVSAQTEVPKDTLIAKAVIIPKTIDMREARIDSVIAKARTYWGIPHASRSKSGLDCSGLMMRSYASIGVKLERTSRSQVHMGAEIPKHKLRKGDLIFFKVRGRIGHVGMVVSNPGEPVRFIHTSASQGVKEDTLDKKFWANCYVTGRRILL